MTDITDRELQERQYGFDILADLDQALNGA